MNKRIFFVIFDFLIVTAMLFALGILGLSQFYISQISNNTDEFRQTMQQKVDTEIENTPDLRAIDRESAQKRGTDLIDTQIKKYEEINTQNRAQYEFIRNVSAGVAVYFAVLLLVIIIRKWRA